MKLQVSSSILYNYLIPSLNFYCVIKQYIYMLRLIFEICAKQQQDKNTKFGEKVCSRRALSN